MAGNVLDRLDKAETRRSELRVIKLSATGVCALASSCNVAMEVGALGLGECGFQPEVPSHAASQRYVQVIDITPTHRGAGVAVQPFFFCASNHSTEPGWGRD